MALQTQLRQFGSNVDLLATGSFVSMLVPLAVFFAFQRFFVPGPDTAGTNQDSSSGLKGGVRRTWR